MDDRTLRRNDILIRGLQNVVDEGSHGIDSLPKFIKKVIREEAWTIRIVESTGQVVEFDSFQQFVESHPPEGLGCSLDRLQRLCDDDDEAGLMIRRATTGKVGRPSKDSKNSDNVTNNGARGNRKSYTLGRLDRERPDLYERVVDGQMSANAAAIEAGFRTKTVSVPVRKGGEVQVERAGDTLIKHFGGDVGRLAEYILANR